MIQTYFPAEFHDVIRGNIPNIIELLKDDDDDVQLAGTSAIKKLIVHSMCLLFSYSVNAYVFLQTCSMIHWFPYSHHC